MIKERFGFVDRLWGFIIPLWIIRRNESLTIVDYRPTFTMLLTVVGFVFLAIAFVLIFFNIDWVDPFVLLAVGIPIALCMIFLFKGTIREVHYFDKTTESYTFIRQFIHRREVIEGALSQFTGAYVKTEEDDESKIYFVILKQDGMFLTGVSEQTLRQEVPVFNSFDRESRIASAISAYLPSKR